MSPQELISWTAEESCQGIINSIRSSCLNFSFQETPYSIYITVRKSFSKSAKSQGSPEIFFSQTNKAESDQQDFIQSKIKMLESANQILTQNFEDSVLELEAVTRDKKISEVKVETLNAKLCDFERKVETIVITKTQAVNSEKRSLQVKHEKLSGELKDAKNESIELRKQVNNLNIALKSSKKKSVK